MNRKTMRQSLTIIGSALAMGFLVWWADGTAEDLGFGYVRRGQRVHFEGGGTTGLWSTRIDSSFSGFTNGFSRALGRQVRVCTSPDAASFEALSEEYTRDKNMVYYKWISPGSFLVIELPEADVATFTPINFAHAIDKNSIWYLDRPILDSDPKTVKLIANRIVKDSKHVYISGEPQPHLDAGTFRSLGSAYYIDANGVYWGRDQIDGADPTTFKVLGDSFVAVDRSSVYRSGIRQPHLDVGSCKLILHDPYGYQVVADENGVYVNNRRFLHADPNDFTMIDEVTARGGQYVFLIDTWHSTPVTVYIEDGCLITSTVLYEKHTANALAIITAEVAGQKLKNLTLSAPPGEAAARKVPDWQINVFQRDHMIKRMKEAGDLLK